MRIKVNGEQEVIESCSLEEFIQQRQINPQALVVEHNRRIVPQEGWSAVQLVEDDSLELLSFVGGG